ncbi:hypothetical protein [Gephyromycinifex aptenodytis]|uniref:hypothetical protein n=1 Tax=Gephyromycinifex aptenodytis TaxID=2716227 RepID=UPI001D015B3A|nr:hypothetical protein [Gephyromycinifex aptenodytis]
MPTPSSGSQACGTAPHHDLDLLATQPETPLEDGRIWVEFDDPQDSHRRFRCDLTWLTSDYHCIFGNGCPGIDVEEPDAGCCVLGAHFTDEDDIARVQAVVQDLGEDEWQYRDLGQLDGWTELEEGNRKTRVVDGACILLNREGFPAGAGCALHQRAVLDGVEPLTVKPDVCWQLPIRRTYRTVELPDGVSQLEVSIAEYDRRGWGPGGHDLDWYCTGAPLAHTASRPLFRTNEPELRELMGDASYAELAERCEAHLSAVGALSSTPAGRKLLPLYIHPATGRARELSARPRRRLT